MAIPQASMPMRGVQTRLGSLLKSDVAIDLLSAPSKGSFRNFVSRAISVLDVQGGAVNIHKSASRTSDVHVLRLRRGSVQLQHADGCVQLEAGQFLAFRGAQALQFRHEQRIDLLAMFLPGWAVERWLPDWQAAEFVPVTDQQAEGRLSFEIAHEGRRHQSSRLCRR
jgi:hypothetical protein